MGGDSFAGNWVDSFAGEPSLEAALASLGFESADELAAWGQQATADQLAIHGMLLSAVMSD
jgi:hypothetical protein